MSQTTRITCTQCGLNRIGLAEEQPCPGCSTTARNIHVTVTESMAATDSLDATLQYPQHRVWWEQWQTAETYLHRLREAYQPDAIGGDARRLANECL